MPDRRKLKVGDRIRIVSIPEGDLRQKEIEIRKGFKDAGWTAKIIETIIDQNPIVEIEWIDEFNSPWFSIIVKMNSKFEEHAIALMDDNSWIYI